ncbi:enoyl-CoA hydratase [Parvibaculum sp.]|jgi:enoyl-CoA hydratase|uniref:enoyl-CoA hydratase n=1 Tax=Parvibaculum sp. TaxID=2024848 RepID=UPI000C3919E5|nr:enoyl-CoA hydratase [Parvibaculum sp.]MAM95636.1 enoyl-CoA hydratase [Parvibaculum sp.]HCX68697.1 enoyl-CoA hydratase [Rhodobiaceae bacterium]|tara:strand:+ start:9755 stop:10540 length:786 start_codon:yes stop_codon:yes gene_type:complete
MSEPVILVEKSGAIATVTLNRPNAMNALSRDLRTAIAETFEQLEADENIRVAILTGAGKAFCAGLDLKELSGDASVGGDVNSTVNDKDPVTSIGRFSGPVIGAINGVAITGGFELALACDVLVCSENARFADTHARVGILPGWGLSQKLSRAIGIYRAKELSLTGNFLNAQQAEEWGLINRVVTAEELLPVCRKLAEDMLSVLPECLPAYKKLIDDGFAESFGDGLKTERTVSSAANKSVSPDAIAERRAGVQNRGKQQTS